jgi:hypothetical protein
LRDALARTSANATGVPYLYFSLIIRINVDGKEETEKGEPRREIRGEA